jgi:Protein of unknown function (DUF1194)
VPLLGKSTKNYLFNEVSKMTRFQVRHKLRQVASKAKNIAIGTSNMGVTKFALNKTATIIPIASKLSKLGLGATSVLLTLGALSPSASFAASIGVATELVLSVDVSGSVDTSEFNLQKQGYVNAFRDTTLQNQISNLPGGIAATLSYWSSSATQSLNWFHITDAASANIFADAIAATTRPFSGGTDIDNAITFAANLLDTNDYVGTRRVIDVSGDGTNSSGINALKAARDNAVNRGIIINGLPILGSERNLDTYYANNVIGGLGSFVLPANSFAEFDNAIKQKIGREIATEPVPEPITILGTLAAGGIGAVLRRKSKRQAEETAQV